MTTPTCEVSIPVDPEAGHKAGGTRAPADKTRKLLLLLAGTCAGIAAVVSSGVMGAFIALETQDRDEAARVDVIRVEASLEAGLKEHNVNMTRLVDLVADFEELFKQGHTSPWEAAAVTSNDTDVDTARRLETAYGVLWDCDPWVSLASSKLQAIDSVWKEASNDKSSRVPRDDPFIETMVKHKDTLGSFCPWLVTWQRQGVGGLAWWVAEHSYGGVLKGFIQHRGNTNLGNMCSWMPLLKKMHTVSYQYGSWELSPHQVTQAVGVSDEVGMTLGLFHSASTSETTKESMGSSSSASFADVFSFGLTSSASIEETITKTFSQRTSKTSTWKTTTTFKWLGSEAETCKDTGAGTSQEIYQFVYNVVYADGHHAAFKTAHVSQLCKQCDALDGDCPPREHGPSAFNNAQLKTSLLLLQPSPLSPTIPLCHVPKYSDRVEQDQVKVCGEKYKFDNNVGSQSKSTTTHGTPAPWSKSAMDLV